MASSLEIVVRFLRGRNRLPVALLHFGFERLRVMQPRARRIIAAQLSDGRQSFIALAFTIERVGLPVKRAFSPRRILRDRIVEILDGFLVFVLIDCARAYCQVAIVFAK